MEEADAGDFVDLPGDTTLWKTQGIPPTRIKLPIEARSRFPWYLPIFGIASVWALSSSVGFYSTAVQNWEAGNSLDRLGWLAGILGCLLVGALFAGTLARAAMDAASSRPSLILTRETLWDRRQLDGPMPWSNVQRVSFISSRASLAAHLKLTRPVYVRSGLFRFGGAVTSRLRSNVVVLISDLDVDERVIKKIIMALPKNVRP
ncbi:hypothetical protein LB535_24580 [Mesorhizobium sp. CA10]|uniref:hypothetical protein n=1 Tax=Mesorhizobium sp. CA10 TaxID=588495 RepID=UPI001CCB97D7|nr:hypothetical protein [Mesorhizobium sp. CA10]MBZ9885518.1 hypothetical protein [Mesorhizobium sp. CA10]